MHELGITRSLIEIAEQHARAQHATRVLSVTVAIGELSGVVAEAVEFCFDVVTQGSFLEGSRLIIERIAGRGRCGACYAEIPLDIHTFACPCCGAFGIEVLQGKDLRITEMEID